MNSSEFLIEGPVEPSYILNLEMSQDLCIFREPPKQQKALAEIAGSDDGMVYLIRDNNTIIGYVTFHNPDKYSRWSNHPGIMELGAIEVSPNYRGHKLGSRLLEYAFANPIMEEKIVITIEFCWHWDLDNTGLDIWKYQKMLSKLFGSVGLVRIPTDDPEILEHIANVLMARFGSNVSEEDLKKFEEMQFCGGSIFNYK
ncbi:acetoin utilization protein AcuA [Desulfotomaculum arcticum]|uniref:Acetoin utilization protein AcuA n=1 Tax=Desulfotruncus arcticus DSM 17038 TaxID=1121424 RepID=A0A1I2S8B1_9FIRM|nr:GNAT family N-acetyltransferase [Desulfotruncus arcticus]SFG47939.1 acetoin utilization protein AcuA [Desulfotomaculum arcticum] [Desulfotruncus arcticus DSM 17038]